MANDLAAALATILGPLKEAHSARRKAKIDMNLSHCKDVRSNKTPHEFTTEAENVQAERPRSANTFMMLHTRICSLFGISVPILNAPMASAAGGALAAAVSEAGGLGLIGAMGHDAGWLRDQIRLARERTNKPFGVGFITYRLPALHDLYDVALSERVAVVAHSFADPAPYVAAARAAGAKVISQVQTVEGALEAARAGVDAIVAQGSEAGGHTGYASTFSLVPDVVRSVESIPVIAAGGIADGRALAAALMLGAEGAWLGTAFLAAPESIYSDNKKRRILEVDGSQTVLSRVFDLAKGEPWPTGIAARAARNSFTEKWAAREGEVESDPREAGAELAGGLAADDVSTVPVWAGTGVGFVNDRSSTTEIVLRIAAETERTLRERTNDLLPPE
jgi:nitronate monooxygenase